MVRWFERNQVYHPAREWVAKPSDLGRPVQDIFFTAADGVRLSAWYFLAGVDSPRRHTAFLVSHGNGGNISHRLLLCRMLLRTGAGVLLYDYRGYGRSEGTLGEEGTYQDAQAAHAWLRQQGITNIISFGESLGGGVASELALRETVAGLVLAGAFTSIADVGVEFFPWLPVRRFNWIKYDTLGKLPRIESPVLVMHSRDDEVIRFRHGERNFAAANEPKRFLELRGGHNEALALGADRCVAELEKFLGGIEQPAVATS